MPLLVGRDVEKVRKYARVLVTLDGQNRLHVRYNSRSPWLSVIAVVGPGEFGGCCYKEAVLCEIGVGRGRPYAQANRPKRSVMAGEHRQIARRRKWFHLTNEQYLAVAPELFGIIRKLTAERMAGWKKNTAIVYLMMSRFFRQRKKFEIHGGYYEIACGVRFSVGFADRQLLADVIWAERSLSSVPRSKIRGIAGLIGLLMSRYRPSRRTTGNGFWKLKYATLAKAIIAKLLSHERVRLIEELRSKKNRPYVRHFLTAVLEAIGEPSPVFSDLKRWTLPHASQRVGDTYIRVVRENGRYLTIQVQPQPVEKPRPAVPDWLPGMGESAGPMPPTAEQVPF